MPLFDADPETKAIVIYSEPGGRMEAQLAEYMKASGSTLPVVAFMAGRFMDEMPGMRFGHAGTIVEGKADTIAEKLARMKDAGISVAEEIQDIPDIVKRRLAGGAA
jgi:succinyl-CoA synthetase alpha subunit